MSQSEKGKIVAITGPVIDVEFEGSVPSIYTALEIVRPDNTGKLVLEVAQHLGNQRVRAIAMGPTEGFIRGAEVLSTGKPISVPVGPGILGRMFNLLGEPIDGLPNLPANTPRKPIHRKPPEFTEQSTEVKIFETGIKVIDLISPFIK